MSLTGIAIAQNNVMKPLRNNAFRVHKFAYSLQHRFEVVLFRLTTHHYVESFVDILKKKIDRWYFLVYKKQ